MTNLQTIRDFLRYAVSQFRLHELVQGHGTTSVIDEAAFLVLEALHLPVDDINPWLDSKLTELERKSLISLISDRVSTRKPAAYLLKRTYMHGIPFHVDERVIVPRSYIGELLIKGDIASLVEDPSSILKVLDVCTGSACLAILAAMAFDEATVDATELSEDALVVAAKNVAMHEMSDRIRLVQGDLFKPVAKARYDLIIANPPYVAQVEVDAFPPEYAAEPQMAHLGGSDGLDFVRRILHEAPAHLNPQGILVCEIGTGRDNINAEFPKLNLTWLDTEESEGEVFVLRP